jgi:hypothetical protein
MWVVDWVLDWLQQTGKGAVRYVAHKITIGLKYKTRPSQISLYILITNFILFQPYILPPSSTVYWEILQLFSEHVNIKMISHSLQYHSNQTAGIHRFVLSVNWNCVNWFIAIHIVTITVNTAAYSCILECLYTLQHSINT